MDGWKRYSPRPDLTSYVLLLNHTSRSSYQLVNITSLEAWLAFSQERRCGCRLNCKAAANRPVPALAEAGPVTDVMVRLISDLAMLSAQVYFNRSFSSTSPSHMV